MNTSASMMAGRSWPSCSTRPRHRHFHLVGACRPSAISTWQPVVMGQKAVELGAVQVLQRILRLPGYRVLQSVKGHTTLLLAPGLPPPLRSWGAEEARLPSSPKCILMAMNRPSISIWRMPAASIRAAQLLSQAGAHRAAEVSKVNGGRLHKVPPLTVAFQAFTAKTL